MWRMAKTHVERGRVRPFLMPDGNKIAFVSSRDGGHNLYVMDAEGSYFTRLTDEMTSYFLLGRGRRRRI